MSEDKTDESDNEKPRDRFKMRKEAFERVMNTEIEKKAKEKAKQISDEIILGEVSGGELVKADDDGELKEVSVESSEDESAETDAGDLFMGESMPGFSQAGVHLHKNDYRQAGKISWDTIDSFKFNMDTGKHEASDPPDFYGKPTINLTHSQINAHMKDTEERLKEVLSDLKEKEEKVKGTTEAWDTEDVESPAKLCSNGTCSEHTIDYVEGMDGEYYCTLKCMRESRDV